MPVIVVLLWYKVTGQTLCSPDGKQWSLPITDSMQHSGLPQFYTLLHLSLPGEIKMLSHMPCNFTGHIAI